MEQVSFLEERLENEGEKNIGWVELLNFGQTDFTVGRFANSAEYYRLAREDYNARKATPLNMIDVQNGPYFWSDTLEMKILQTNISHQNYQLALNEFEGDLQQMTNAMARAIKNKTPSSAYNSRQYLGSQVSGYRLLRSHKTIDTCRPNLSRVV